MVSKKPRAAVDHCLRAQIYTIGASSQVTSIHLEVQSDIKFTITAYGGQIAENDFSPADPRGIVRVKRLEHLAIHAFEFFPI
jgi:hypothetical protein